MYLERPYSISESIQITMDANFFSALHCIAFKDLRPISWLLNSSNFSKKFFFERQGDKEIQRGKDRDMFDLLADFQNSPTARSVSG